MATTRPPLKSALQRHVEDVFGDKLEHLFARWAGDEDLSCSAIAKRLRQHGIEVTPQTVWNWARGLGGRATWVFPEEAPRA